MNEAHDPIAQAAARAVQGVAELREENVRHATRADAFEKQCAIQAAELEMTKVALKTASADRDRYQRFNIELTTQLNNVANLIGDCFERAKHAQYIPQPAPPEQIAQPTIEEEIPKFLQNGPAIKS